MKELHLIKLTLISLLLLSNNVIAQVQILQLKPDSTSGIDAYINSLSNLQQQNFGNSPNIFACAWTYGGEFGEGKSFFKFDLTQIPTTATVLSAKFNLRYDPLNSWYYQCGNNACFLKKVVQHWSEDSVSWLTQPETSTDNEIYLPKSDYMDQDYLGIIVTGIVQQMVSYPESNEGFALEMIDLNPYTCMLFASSDNDNPELWPELVIEYTNCTKPIVDYSYSVEQHKVSYNGICEDAIAWHWDFDNGYQSDLQNPEIIYENEGTYNVCLYVENECGAKDTICKEVVVCNKLKADFVYNNLADTYYSFIDSSKFASSWYWDFNDGFFSELQNPVHFFNAPGVYNVCLYVTSNCYKDTICKPINISVYGTFSDASSDVEVSPNPSCSYFRIKFNELNLPEQMILISSTGRELLHFENLKLGNEFLIPKQAKGIYMLKVEFPDKTICKKLISL